MERVPVLSSNIAGMAYDAQNKILEVEFKSGTVHSYQGVEPEVYQAMQSAQSLGSYFHKYIRNQYFSQKIS